MIIISIISFFLIIPLTILAFEFNLLQWVEDGQEYDLGLLIVIVHMLYYQIFEWLFGTSIGKLITRTKIIRAEGEKVKFKDVLIRSICRLIPFDQFSYLSSNPVGWHDDLSNTRVINVNDIKRK